ncbi:hypothetical protein HCG49_06830 [Arenibacter sp. 6A1]|uniref:hypothetical protein n=1 Tax=Arenibacter sp. 6A1 TaxID=2720391 RepID=UPI001447D12F|nr:hypothetical protein [Arenibacter sp. 6A1]NKI26272.1 hypothetical protein [Arenibacter sp. 6A1]
MRKFSLVVVAAVMLLSFGNSFATERENRNPAKSLSEQIGQLLEGNDIRVNQGEDLFATVYFTINSEMELVVLSVATEEEGLDAFVKNRLNYNKVSAEGYEEGKTYKVPVRLKS